MNNLILFVLLIVLLFLFSCHQSSVVIKNNENGSKYEEYQITEDSIKNGYYFQFYENQDTFIKAWYVNGKLEGQRSIYYEGNKVEYIENYVRDSLEGLYQKFYLSGELKIDMTYHKHTLNGILTKYYKNGNITESVTMQNNDENGPFTEYYENGAKSWEGTYVNGDNERGLLIEFAENGDTIRKMNCDELSICRTFYRNEKYPKNE